MYNRQCVRDARVGLPIQIHAGPVQPFLSPRRLADKRPNPWGLASLFNPFEHHEDEATQ